MNLWMARVTKDGPIVGLFLVIYSRTSWPTLSAESGIATSFLYGLTTLGTVMRRLLIKTHSVATLCNIAKAISEE